MTSHRSTQGRFAGPLLAVGAAVAFALSIPLGKRLLDDMSAFTLSGLLYLGAGLGITAYRRLAERNEPASNNDAAQRGRNTAFLAAAIASGGVAAPLLLFWGLSSTPAVVASLLLSLEVILTAVIARPFFHEHIALRVWGAVALMAAAVAMLGWSGSGWAWSTGTTAVALATLFWALDNNLTREVSGYSPARIAQIKGLVAGTVNLSIGLAVSKEFPNLTSAAITAAVGAISYGLSLVLFIHSLRLLGSARTGSYFASAPLMAAVFSVLLFRESLTLRLGGAFVLVGLAGALMVSESHAHEHAHDDLMHSHWHWPDEDHRHQHRSV